MLLLDTLLGKTRSNTRLMSISADEGLAYAVSSAIYLFSEIGLFTVHIRTAPKSCQKAYERVLEEISKIKQNKVSEEELAKAKNYYRGSLTISTNDPVERSFFYGLQDLLEEKVISRDEFFSTLDSVTAEQVQEIANLIFDETRLHAVMVGQTN